MNKFKHTKTLDMLPAIPAIPSETSKISEFKEFLKEIGVCHSFKKKDEYIGRIQLFKNNLSFPWRKDQKDIIDSFLEQKYKYYVLNGIFGAGKTTNLLGIHIHSMVNRIYRSDEAMFISFNVCIKNELIQKLRAYGMGSKTKVRTFDSIVYEICRLYEYPYLDLPNYEGKRKFVYKICKEILCSETQEKSLSNDPKFIFIDECQDLEHQTLILFQTFFSKAQIIFAGDIFQSIQKEPRESLLWFLLNCPNEDNAISRHYMKETPRVPDQILKSVKKSLISYYPEFEKEIGEWRSSSLEMDTKIEWHRFYNYSDIFKQIDHFLETHDPLKSMILTFSSAITVKGAMGDLARIRRYLSTKGHSVNNNHKKMDRDKLFLSTVNSSKGLEREYVMVISTFPLERAFMNFSNDLVINLITVGMTRTKKEIIFYVPAYEDKFSTTLENYMDCPLPNKAKIRDGKSVIDFKFGDYFHMEHCVTEILKQNIIKYDTRIKLRAHIKQFETDRVFDNSIPAPKIATEEERGFIGILIENLITSLWVGRWPSLDDIEILRNHPMYTHCFKKIEDRLKKYVSFISGKECSGSNHFEGIYYYSQLHLAMYNKIFIDLSKSTYEYMKTYWRTLEPKALSIKPNDGKISVQGNMRMPWVTGICDAMISKHVQKDSEKTNDEITIWELKASIDFDWKENALIQAVIYALMSGKSWCRIVLLNPFRNEKCSYYFNMKKVMYLRELVINDMLIWNTNCYLSKNSKVRGKTLSVTNNLFLYMKKGNGGKFAQYSVFQFMSPTKIDLIHNVFIKTPSTKCRKDLSKLEKLCNDVEMEEKEALDKLYETLNSSQYRDLTVYYSGDCELEEKRYVRVEDVTGYDIVMLDELHYEKNIELKYEADFDDALVRALTIACYLGKEYKLV